MIPYVQYDEQSKRISAEVLSKFKEIEELINISVPECRSLSLCLTKLEECQMWFGKSVVEYQLSREKK